MLDLCKSLNRAEFAMAWLALISGVILVIAKIIYNIFS